MPLPHPSRQVLSSRPVPGLDCRVSCRRPFDQLLYIINGLIYHRTMDEAFDITEAAKSRFINQKDDVYERGKRLVRESIECGVTAMRVFVDVDAIVHLRCLKVAIRLQEEFKDSCDIQIAGQSYHIFIMGRFLTRVKHSGCPSRSLRFGRLNTAWYHLRSAQGCRCTP